MTFPCIADTDTIVLRIVNGAIEASVQVSADLGNALVADDGGLYVPGPTNDVARLFGVTQAIGATGVKTAVALTGSRFAAPAGMVTAGPTITALRTGLYHVAATVTFDPPAASGTFRLVSIKAGATQTYPSLEPTQTATTAFTSAFMAASFSGVVFLPVGTTLSLEYQQDAGVAANLVIVDAAGIELMANLLVEVA